ncbi:MAG TPA: penicillin-binding transpeptidase domain-containing protein [Lachnospiraceae bacterium]|nr:penicillin-binding transpeptidase domain-containing protein [Lachnospiraceae bacterium]
MFSDFKDFMKNVITSRLFVLLIAFIVMSTALIQRLFVLQIVNGESYVDNFELTIRKEKTLKSTRGNIYDCNGELLAYNELAYSVTIEDTYESGSEKNALINDTIYRACKIIEKNGDKVIEDFNIHLDRYGEFEFSIEGTALLRFLADVYGRAKIEDLKYKEKNATPRQVIEYLGGQKKFAIGAYDDPVEKTTFIVGKDMTDAELLQIVTIRYMISTNSYQKYLATTISKDVKESTVAAIMENLDTLQGVDISEDTLRRYVDSEYFSHIIGYTGNISTEELATLSAEDDSYILTDMVGKAGIEQVMETYLQGRKGKEVFYADSLGKVIQTSQRIEPEAGNDIYLTIDAELQKAVYNLLEQKLAGVLVAKIDNVKEVNKTDVASSKIRIPIDDVYYALLNNNVVDISHFGESDAKEYEKQIYQKFLDKENRAINSLMTELTTTATPYNQLAKEMQVYESYVTTMLSSANTGVLLDSEIDKNDDMYVNWKAETISLKEYLNYAIAQNWIDISKFELDTQYSDSSQIYEKLLAYIDENLRKDTGFSKKVYRYMIRDNEISGKEICMTLFEQRVIEGTTSEKEAVESGGITAYTFLLDKIAKLEITPAQLALDPCSGSCVITSVDGEVKACVTYPGYDTNKLANTIDAKYWNSLRTDLSLPMYDYATQQRTAPGSTFKMLSAVAGLEEGVVGVNDLIKCVGIYETILPSPKCWIYPNGTHGDLNIVGAIRHSCNYFFYEVGYRLSTNATQGYDAELGLNRLSKYADMFGLSEKSGIEIVENEPRVSDELPVQSAIGQGTNSYTTVGLARYVNTVANRGTCYNLSLLDRRTDSKGNLLEDYTPQVRNKVNIQDSTWNAVHSGMRGVVENTNAFKDITLPVAGKTGTAQEQTNRANHALFLCFAPYDAPEISVATRIAFGYTSAYAAELTRDVIKYYFELEDAEELVSGEASEIEGTIIED